jgi:hypothetical protein
MTSLRSLILHSVSDLPPVVAPEITRLIVKDRCTDFTNDILTEILGFAAAAPAIRDLDLLVSPVSNAELAIIMDQCKEVAFFRLSSGGETRTDAYVKLTSRALDGYIQAPENRLLEVQFSHHPPSNNRKARARERFDRLVSVGASCGLTITFNIDFYRLKVITNIRYFNHNVDTRRLTVENNLNSALIVVRHSIVKKGRDTVLQLVIVLRDRSAALRIRDNGLLIHGRINYDVTMTIFTTQNN